MDKSENNATQLKNTVRKKKRRHDTNKDRKFRNETTKDQRRDIEIKDTAESALKSKRDILKRSDYNDPEWYAANPQLLADAFSISVADRLGLPITVDVPNNAATAFPFTTQTKYTIPGIMSIEMAPVPGISRNSTSPVNMAAKLVFSKVRKLNSSLSDYQASDLMMYLLAVDQGYILWNWLTRIYGLIMMYEQKNAYMPRGLYASMNVDPSVADDMSALRTLINTLGIRLQTLAVPTIASYYARHAWLFGGVYLDAPNDKAQAYIYNPSIIYEWVEETEELQLPYLNPVQITGTTAPWKLDGLRALVEEIIEPIVFSEDFRLMAGDIRKAFDESELYHVGPIDESYMCVPTFVEEVLTQIENAKSLGQWAAQTFDNTWRIQQEAAHEAIIFNPTVMVSTGMLGDRNIYNFHTDTVDPKIVAVATRLNFVVDETTTEAPSGGRHVSTKLQSCGTEIVTAFRIWTLSGSVFNNVSFGNTMELYSDQDFGSSSQYISTLCKISQFDWAPLQQIYMMKGDGTNPAFLGYIGDLDNYTVINDANLITMNDVALLSMFGVPNGYTTRTKI